MHEPLTEQHLFKWIEKQERDAQQFGFCWENIHQLIEQIRSECLEIQEAWDKGMSAPLQEEVGDLIHAVITLAIFCKLDPYETLLKSIEKFQRRYNMVVQIAQIDGHENLRQQPFQVLVDYWQKAKKQTK